MKYFLDCLDAYVGGKMKFSCQELEAFYNTLPIPAQLFLIAMGAAILFMSGGVIGSSIGKALYFLIN
ncbi:hypothetical protein [Massilia suwonensis]|uniref:Uncharacterized protein n=1 Tax=Massilia suwonensis TaxID=648895 RepID=A0ABW0MHA2_9BURK